MRRKGGRKQLNFLEETLMLLAIVEWEGDDALIVLAASGIFFPKFFFSIDWIIFFMSLILFSMPLSLFLTIHSSNEYYSFFVEEVGSDFWEAVGNFLDKLLLLFGLIVFLGGDSVAIDKLLVLFSLVIFFVSWLILK